MKSCHWLIGTLASFLLSSSLFAYPQTPIRPVSEPLHGTVVTDDYRWLEEGSNAEVVAWTEAQNRLTRDYLESLTCSQALTTRLEALARYEATNTYEVPVGDARFIWSKQSGDERWRFGYQAHPGAAAVELLNPNSWEDETLDFASPSPDGSHVAYAVSVGGNERPVIRVLEVATGNVLSDTVRGSKQGWPEGDVHWLPDGSGFFYGAHPDLQEVAAGEAEYWHAVYWHALGTAAESDVKVFGHDRVREYFHGVSVSDDGEWLALLRFNSACGSEVFLKRRQGANSELIPLATGFTANYSATFAGNQLLLVTDEGAPNYRAFLVDPSQPAREHWQLLLPETDDRLVEVAPVGGRFYAAYLHHAHTVIKVYSASGIYLRDVSLPTIGTASVSGFWSKDKVWVELSSFALPSTRYSFNSQNGELALFEAPKVPIDSSAFSVEQVWYPSRDGTMVSMFLIRDTRHVAKGPQPTLLSGYGGFGISITPSFGDLYIPFLEAGGVVAIPNLRGGGEYGEAWHDAGRRAKKQNVFDDFIAAAEWLIQHDITTPCDLAIRGRSNGGLLMGAMLTQRPDLFRAVLCEVPLLDMLRYHRFGYSNVWSTEYGSAENAEQFDYLLEYSPYHRVVDGCRYPAVLVRGAENDARTDALHARKMAARLQAADPDGLPKLLLVDKESGHLGGTRISQQVKAKAEGLSFIMDQLGMK